MSEGALLAVRFLQPRDRSGWERLWRAYLAFYGAERPQEVIDTTWDRLIFDGDGPNGFVALDFGGRPVGIAHYLFHVSTWSAGPSCLLQDLFVAPEARGGGIGRALVEAVHEAAQKGGAESFYWLVQDFDVTARRLFDKLAEKTAFVMYRWPMP